MNNQHSSLPISNTTLSMQETKGQAKTVAPPPTHPPTGNGGDVARVTPFWHDRFVECGLILSMALYYLVGNPHITIGHLSRLNPLLSLPFLLIFAVLCWYRLPFAVALLPLSLPYYLLPKTVVSHYAFSLAEVTLGTCLGVAFLQFLFTRSRWRYRFSWSELRDRLGPFALPILVFFATAALSIGVAYARVVALRAFRKEVLDPLLYLGLALTCLRSRQDVTRLLGAFLGTGLVIALLGMAQYFLFRNLLVLEDGIRRVHAVYGSANSIGLLFDYVLPIGLALVMASVSWRSRLLAAVLCMPLLFVLYLSQSRGAWVAIAVAALFIAALSIRNRRLLLIGGLLAIIIVSIVLLIFHIPLLNLLLEGHTSRQGVSTVTRRLYLWQSAWRMIHDSPWLGYGMDNWLCHYSKNIVCDSHTFHYWILKDPITGARTGLLDEPTLSHPHNIFLHVWVSMGIFGMLAFGAVLVLFYWLFARILAHLHATKVEGREQLRWMTIGVGAAMLAALMQGQVDSAFLEQDLAFCFWMLVAALLLLRLLAGVPWRDPDAQHL